MKIFCLSIYNNNFNQLNKLNLIPVGLGDQIFNSKWITDKGTHNISNKNENFGEYTFHYHLWKNEINKQNYNDWIGFCSYRRFWTTIFKKNVNSLEELKNIIIKKEQENWKNFEVVLGEPLIFNKIKSSKLIKRNILEVIKKPSVLFKNTSLMDQFKIFHGSYF